MKQLKAKFQCNDVTHYPAYDQEKQHHIPGGAEKARLSAVHGGSKNSEDNQFSAATPFGQIEMQVDNPSAKGFLQPGKKYYVYFEECEDQSN